MMSSNCNWLILLETSFTMVRTASLLLDDKKNLSLHCLYTFLIISFSFTKLLPVSEVKCYAHLCKFIINLISKDSNFSINWMQNLYPGSELAKLLITKYTLYFIPIVCHRFYFHERERLLWLKLPVTLLLAQSH